MYTALAVPKRRCALNLSSNQEEACKGWRRWSSTLARWEAPAVCAKWSHHFPQYINRLRKIIHTCLSHILYFLCPKLKFHLSFCSPVCSTAGDLRSPTGHLLLAKYACQPSVSNFLLLVSTIVDSLAMKRAIFCLQIREQQTNHRHP